MTENDHSVLLGVRLLTLEVDMRARTAVNLPRWLGSTLHGSIGHALRSIGDEPYARFFETVEPPDGSPAHLRAMGGPALIIAPPAPRTRSWPLAEAELLQFALVLPTCRSGDIGYLLAGLQRAAERGLGRGKAPLDLVEVRDQHGVVWRDGRVVRAAQIDPQRDRHPFTTNVTVTARTPLRIHRKGKLLTTPSFGDFVGAACRRLAAHQALFDGNVPTLNLAEVARAASSVATADASWRQFHAQRYSSRQKRRIPVEGVLGRATFVGPEVSTFAPLVEAAARLGIGKAPAFGFGRLVTSAEPASNVEGPAPQTRR